MTIRFACAALLLVLLPTSNSGQSPSLPAFDAASVKPVQRGDVRGSTFQFTTGGGQQVTNGTLKGLTETGYGVRDFQILGGPEWLDSARFVDANPDSPSIFTALQEQLGLKLDATRAAIEVIIVDEAKKPGDN